MKYVNTWHNPILPFLFIGLIFHDGNRTGTADKPIPSKAILVYKEVQKPAPVENVPHNNNAIAFKQIPVLCYHQVRERKKSDSKFANTYIITPQRFKEHIAALVTAGYKSMLPHEIPGQSHERNIKTSKQIMISFDDGTAGQYNHAVPILNTAGYKAVFFIMTVALNKPGYLTDHQVKELAKDGHVIGSHTWDHHPVTQYKSVDWIKQLTQPTMRLSELIEQPILYFAYPYGMWNRDAIRQLKLNGYAAAFQLSGSFDTSNTAYTIRRIIADSRWSGNQLLEAIELSF